MDGKLEQIKYKGIERNSRRNLLALGQHKNSCSIYYKD